jgi:competence protein ComEC
MPARPLPVLAVSLLLGTLTGAASFYLPVASFVLTALLLGILLIVTSIGRLKPSFACFIYGLFLCGMVSAAVSYSRTATFTLPASTGLEKLDLVGEISEPVRYGPSRASAVVSLRRILTADNTIPVEGRIRLTMHGDPPALIVGDVIRFQTRLRLPHSQLNPGGFDYESYLLHHRIQALGHVHLSGPDSAVQVLDHIPHLILDRADSWRARIRDAAMRTLSAPASSVYLALITGESGYLSQETRDIFMSSGTTHILSISGSHLGLIGVVVFWLVRRAVLALPSSWLLPLSLRLTATKIAAAFTIPIVSFYAILGGAEVATVRSLLMVGLFLVAVLLGRTHHLATGLAFAALLIVLWDPMAPLDLSFQLSFLSVLAIVLLLDRKREAPVTIADGLLRQADGPRLGAGGFRSRTEHALRSIGTSARELIFLGAAIAVLTTPLVAMHFHQIAWVGLVANLVIVPFVGFVVVPIGLLGCVATLLSGSQSLQGAMLIQPGIEMMLWVVHGFASLPGARWMVVSPRVWQIVFFYACVAGILWSPSRWLRRIGVVTAAALLVVWVWSPRDLPGKGSVRLTFLDVGQGDAAVIEMWDGPVMLVDGGGASDSSDHGRTVVAPFLWDRGIRRLDVVIATHPQLDHVGGLSSIVREFTVGELWTNGIERDTPFVRRFEEVTKARDIPVRVVTSADPPILLGSCLIHILNPAPRPSRSSMGEGSETVSPTPRAPEGRHLNNQSVVVRLQCGNLATLFTGDIEHEAEERLVDTGSLASGILKVPHHGSRGSLSERFLNAVNPEVAVVSAGRANPYGHPAAAMLELYRRLNIAVLRTDRDGAITIVQSTSNRHVMCEAVRRMKRIAPNRSGSWRGELDNLRRLGRAEIPCING